MTRLCLLLIASVLCLPLLAEATVTSIFKKPVIGKVVKLDVQGRIEVKVKGSDVPERIPLDEIETIDFGQKGDERRPDETPLRVYLINGDVLYGAPAEGPKDEGELFLLKNERFGELTIDIQMIRRIENVRTVKPNVLPDLEKSARFDCAYFVPKDGVKTSLDPRAEIIRVTKEGLWIYNDLLDEEERPEGTLFQWNGLRGVVCKRDAPETFKKLMAIVTVRDGSILRGVLKKWADGKIELEHRILQTTITLEEKNLLSIAMKNGRYLYLSDLDFAETPKERPYYLPAGFKYEEYAFKVRRDQAQGGGALSIRGKMYAKGLGVHAISRIKYRLNKSYRRLVAEVGVDDSAGDLASLEFKVYGDGKLLWKSGVLRRTSGAKAFDLEVLNVVELVLEVTAADNADIQDRGNWANIKVVR